MLNELPLQWIAYGIVLLVTLKCLTSMATARRDRLQGLLVSHAKRQQMEAMKRQRIKELRESIRAKKAARKSSDETQAA
jgi:heme exporter protein D